jgi:signal transduction histidine kinase
MIKSFPALLSLILCLSGLTVHAQDGRLPAPISVTINSYQSIQELPQPDWVIKEGETPLTIQDILNGDIKDGQVLEVHANEKIIEHYKKYWFAIEFISEVELSNWLLYVENTDSGFGFTNNFSEIRSYAIQDGKLGQSGITGYFVPASQRDYHSRHTQSLLNLSLSTGSRMTLWVHISKNHTLTDYFPKLTIYDPSIALPEYTLERRDLLYFGSIFMIWLLSVMMYIFLKDRTALWFFVFMTAIIVDNATAWSSDPLTSVLFPENPKNGLDFGVWTSFLMVACLLQFSRVFANLPSKNKKLNKIMIWATIVLFFSSLIAFYCSIYFEDNNFVKAWYLIYGFILISAGTIYLTLKDALSKFIGLAILLFIIPQLIPLTFDDKFLAYSGLLITMVLGVGYRVKLLFQDRLQVEREKKDLVIDQNTILEKQVAERTSELNHSLDNLKSTQVQLIQQEKLASLGQLTAGIAHEIKNPLNFVNNFSEVSLELIEEALEEIAKIQGNEHATESVEILADIKSNLTKIHEHGTRANSVVTSMLQHSRGGSGKKEPTDLNALIKEYVNLSFHGMRAGKDPIDVEIDLQLDDSVGEVPVVAEDFSRVIMNLCGNAFDAMRSLGAERSAHGESYSPKLTVSTKSENGQILIEVQDNGPGIPDEIKDKILQPFFTTKKGTEGTGLGLSITHDIVKAHGGSISISSDANGSIFMLTLPKNS